MSEGGRPQVPLTWWQKAIGLAIFVPTVAIIIGALWGGAVWIWRWAL